MTRRTFGEHKPAGLLQKDFHVLVSLMLGPLRHLDIIEAAIL
jgi:hypothetical protein